PRRRAAVRARLSAPGSRRDTFAHSSPRHALPPRAVDFFVLDRGFRAARSGRRFASRPLRGLREPDLVPPETRAVEPVRARVRACGRFGVAPTTSNVKPPTGAP